MQYNVCDRGECWELHCLKQKNNELTIRIMELGRILKKPWYNQNDIEGYRKFLTLMFTLESPDMGEKFAEAVKNWNFPILNHFILNTEIGKEKFPGMTVINLRTICDYQKL